MAIRTVVDTVEAVEGPPADVQALAEEIDRLRRAHPGVHFSRYLEHTPEIAADVWIAPGAVVVGSVSLARQSSVWYGCVLRADVNRIEVGERSNLQDGCVVHLGDRDPTIIGTDVVVGHRAVLHGCRVEQRCLVGIAATVLDGAVIGAGSIVAAGALVTAGTVIAPRSLVVGTPGRVVRTLDEDMGEFNAGLAAKYTRLAHNYRVG